MCGIVGYVGSEPCAPILLDGLRRLEYRGYDSAGVAVVEEGRLRTVRAVGKLQNLDSALRDDMPQGHAGIGHTRWATHGAPSEVNAHPHVVDTVAVVHNGIIENHMELRAAVESEGGTITSDTDTEIVAHLVASGLRAKRSLKDAVLHTVSQIRGAYAIAVVSSEHPDQMVVARHASPLVIGSVEGAGLCASDVPALLPYTRKMIFLEDGDVAVVRAETFEIVRTDGTAADRAWQHIQWSPVAAEKAGFKHFMLKEIHEQPRALEDTLRGRLNREAGEVYDQEIGLEPRLAKDAQRLVLLACGTSYHAALVAKYWLEALAGVATDVELASEFRARQPVVGTGTLCVAVSQSGETLDTLMAAQQAHHRGSDVVAIVNVIGSAIARMSNAAFYTHAGPEIGVASTKCFSATLANLFMLAVWMGRHRGALSTEQSREWVEQLARVPQHLNDVVLSTRQLVANLAQRYGEAHDVLFLGRGPNFPIALEGALKLKEISYAHAEGYAAGEMKHGPIALIEPGTPVVVISPQDSWRSRSMGNLHEVKARGASVIALGTHGDDEIRARLPTLLSSCLKSTSGSTPFSPSYLCSSTPIMSPTSKGQTWISLAISPRRSP